MRGAKRVVAAVACGLALGAAAPAVAEEDALSAFGSLSTGELGALSGGADTVDLRTIAQVNSSDSEGTNSGNAIVNDGPGASMVNGAISAVTLAGNRGMAAVIQNTGSLVNVNYTMSVNVYLQ